MKERASYRYILSLGSNLGDRKKNCKRGLKGLRAFCHIEKISPLIETTPLKSKDYPSLGEGNYFNQVCEVISHEEPPSLYDKIVLIEDEIGHSRERKWLPRELDIDILLWAQNTHSAFSHCPLLSYEQNSLLIPHKGLLEREFLLQLSEAYLGIIPKELLSA